MPWDVILMQTSHKIFKITSKSFIFCCHPRRSLFPIGIRSKPKLFRTGAPLCAASWKLGVTDRLIFWSTLTVENRKGMVSKRHVPENKYYTLYIYVYMCVLHSQCVCIHSPTSSLFSISQSHLCIDLVLFQLYLGRLGLIAFWYRQKSPELSYIFSYQKKTGDTSFTPSRSGVKGHRSSEVVNVATITGTAGDVPWGLWIRFY